MLKTLLFLVVGFLVSAQSVASAETPSPEHVVAVIKAQKSAYAITNATNGCPTPATDILGWPSALLRECVYSVGPKAHRLTGYVLLIDVKPETIATWIETACAQVLPTPGKCFETVLECAQVNSGMMFPIAGNMIEDGVNWFFRNGMTVRMPKQANQTPEQIPLDRQKKLALMPDSKITRIKTGLTRFWRTLPAQFSARFPGENIPQSVTTAADRQKWLAIARSEFLTALTRPNNRLLEAWIGAHQITLAAGTCPLDNQP